MGGSRRVFWGSFVDANQPDRFVAHLRQDERMIASDVVYESRAKSFDLGDAPQVTHLISADAVAGRNVGSLKRDSNAAKGIVEAEPTLRKVQL